MGMLEYEISEMSILIISLVTSGTFRKRQQNGPVSQSTFLMFNSLTNGGYLFESHIFSKMLDLLDMLDTIQHLKMLDISNIQHPT